MKKILVLLAEGFELFEAGAFIDVFGWNMTDGDRDTIPVTCGLRKTIRTSFGQEFVCNSTVDLIDTDDFSAICIPGGFKEYDFYTDAYDESFLETIRAFHQKGKPIATICTGALPAAKSGILNRKKATVYRFNPERRDELESFGAMYSDTRVCIDSGIITSSDPSTAVEVALEALSMVTSPENAGRIKHIMGF